MYYIWSIYCSPCLRLTNSAGNSCLHAEPITAVSSNAANLLEVRKVAPASNSACYRTIKVYSHGNNGVPEIIASYHLLQQQTHQLTPDCRKRDFHVEPIYDSLKPLSCEEVQKGHPMHRLLFHHPNVLYLLYMSCESIVIPLDRMDTCFQQLNQKRDASFHALKTCD